MSETIVEMDCYKISRSKLGMPAFYWNLSMNILFRDMNNNKSEYTCLMCDKSHLKNIPGVLDPQDNLILQRQVRP